MFHHTRSRALGRLLLCVVMTVPLMATTVHADWAGWQSGVDSFELVDFEGLTDTFASYSGGLTLGNAQFVGSIDPLWVVNSAANPSHDFGTGSVLKGPVYWPGAGREIQVTVPTDTTAVAFDLMTVGTTPETFTVMLSNGESWSDLLTISGLTPRFFGVTSDVPFSEVHLLLTTGTASLTYPVIDNVAFGITGAGPGGGDPLPPPGAETPEVATLLLVGSGLLLIWRMRGRVPDAA